VEEKGSDLFAGETEETHEISGIKAGFWVEIRNSHFPNSKQES
jgi:hypothetical protein